MAEYDFTHIVLRARDLRNYHTQVKDEIAAQPEHSVRDEIVTLLSSMEDELAALEKFVAEGSATSKLAQAKAKLEAAQAELESLRQQE